MPEAPDLIHPTYRYLDRQVRLAGLTLAQWTQLVAGGVGAWLLARVLPFSATYDLSIAVTLAGVPIAASLAASTDTVHPLAFLRQAARWRRRAAIYLPALDSKPHGYALGHESRTHRVVATASPDATSNAWWD